MPTSKRSKRSYGEVNSARHSVRVGSQNTSLRRSTMAVAANRTEAPVAIHVDLAAIFVSLELSRSKWLVTSLSPGTGERMSKRVVEGSDVPGLLVHLAELQRKAKARTGQSFRI